MWREGRNGTRPSTGRPVRDSSISSPGREFHGGNNPGKRAAPIHVRYQDYWGLGYLGHLHVHQVFVLEIYLGRAARPFYDDNVEILAKCVISPADYLKELAPAVEIFLSRHVPDGLAHNYHL